MDSFTYGSREGKGGKNVAGFYESGALVLGPETRTGGTHHRKPEDAHLSAHISSRYLLDADKGYGPRLSQGSDLDGRLCVHCYDHRSKLENTGEREEKEITYMNTISSRNTSLSLATINKGGRPPRYPKTGEISG